MISIRQQCHYKLIGNNIYHKRSCYPCLSTAPNEASPMLRSPFGGGLTTQKLAVAFLTFVPKIQARCVAYSQCNCGWEI